MMLTTEPLVNDDSSSSPNLWRENLEKAQYYKVVASLFSIYLYSYYNINGLFAFYFISRCMS